MLEILKETTGRQRNRRYSYVPYLKLFESSATALQNPTDCRTWSRSWIGINPASRYKIISSNTLRRVKRSASSSTNSRA